MPTKSITRDWRKSISIAKLLWSIVQIMGSKLSTFTINAKPSRHLYRKFVPQVISHSFHRNSHCIEFNGFSVIKGLQQFVNRKQ